MYPGLPTFYALTPSFLYLCFFFNDTATTEIYTLSLHDALPIYIDRWGHLRPRHRDLHRRDDQHQHARSEEHTSELQSRLQLVCRLLLEKKIRAGADAAAARCWIRGAHALARLQTP